MGRNQPAARRSRPRIGEAMSQDLLRHTVATLAYRAGKTLRGAPPTFSTFRAAPGSRSAGEILAHVGDLLDWAISLVQGHETWNNSVPSDWDADVTRFFNALTTLDGALAAGSAQGWSAEQLFQGPIADALSHIGQIAMLRRLAGVPVRGENYAVAGISAGRVGPDQQAPRYEFD